MDATVVVLLALDFVSLMLTVILVTAWSSFGRPTHALTWGAAFAIAAAGWSLRLLNPGPADASLIQTAARILSMVTWAMVLVGFRQRAGLPGTARLVGVALAVAVAALVVCTLHEHRGGIHGVPQGFAAVMLALSAATMMFRAGNPAERAVISMLLALSILDVVGSVFAFSMGPAGHPGRLEAFRSLMMVTQPSAFVGAGLFAVFLLASDLAERMGRLAACDALTGVLNRRGFEEAAERAMASARRRGEPLAVVVADLDLFKGINDRFGHAAGDAVLCRFVEHVTGSIRGGDLFARIGGEEFALLMVGAPPAAAAEAVDRIRLSLGRIAVETCRGTLNVTASFGVTGPASADEPLADMLARADQALYRSKLGGRDRVTVALPPAPQSASLPVLLEGACRTPPLLAA